MYIVVRYICIEVRYIVHGYINIIRYKSPKGDDQLDARIKKVYVPMTESAFYILLCLQSENHGYGIVQQVDELTGGEVRLSPGTMYGSLSKMEKDGLISFIRTEEKRKIYHITDLGHEVLKTEMKRIARIYKNLQEFKYE